MCLCYRLRANKAEKLFSFAHLEHMTEQRQGTPEIVSRAMALGCGGLTVMHKSGGASIYTPHAISRKLLGPFR